MVLVVHFAVKLKQTNYYDIQYLLNYFNHYIYNNDFSLFEP